MSGVTGAIAAAGAAPSHSPIAGESAWKAAARTLRARAAAVTIPGPASALAIPVPKITLHDPTGDAAAPQGDVTGVGLAQNVSGTSFAVTVKSAANPATDPIWLAGGALIFFAVDVNNDGILDDAGLMTSDPTGALVALVGGPSGPNLNCDPKGVYVPHVGYRIDAPAGCLPTFGTVRFGVEMTYDDPNDLNPPPPDDAPDSGFGPAINVQLGGGPNGYWMLGADGHVYPFGGAIGFPGLVAGATAMAPRKDGKGYWVVDRVGHVFAYGSARFFGGSPALGAGEFVSTISATPSGSGYWLFTNRGRAFAFGNASNYGDMSGTPLNGPVVASVATPSGHGYYMVGSDGGIFSFGDAHFHGSTGNLRLNKPVVGISPTPDGKGYWLVASDGGVFAFSAPFRGSMGATRLNKAVDGLVAFGNGYLMAASDGGIFDFSNKPFLGSLGGKPLAAPIIGLAAFSS